MKHFKFICFWLILSVAHASLAPERNPRSNPIDIDFYYLATDHEFDASQFSDDADQSPSTHLETKQPKSTPCATSNCTNCNLFKATAFVMMVLLAGAFMGCSRYKLISSFVWMLLISFAIQATPTHAIYEQTTQLIADDGAAWDYFGSAVSQYGDYAAVGAYYADNSKGLVYIFRKSNDGWKQDQELFADDGVAHDYFGSAVSLHADHLAISAVGDASVYIFSKTNDGWIQTGKLTADDGDDYMKFGYAVSLHADHLAIGASSDDSGKGSVYMFSRTDDRWNQTDKLTADDGVNNGQFGTAVSLHADHLAIGAYIDDSGKGSVYMFSKTDDGWNQTDKLTADDGVASDQFGRAVSLHVDHLAIGAYGDDNHKGSVYMVSKTGDEWNQTEKLTADDGVADDYFGVAVSLHADHLAIGAFGDDNRKGSVYMFSKTGDGWNKTEKLTAVDGVADDNFGRAVSLFDASVAVGARGYKNFSGSLYMFSDIATQTAQCEEVSTFKWEALMSNGSLYGSKPKVVASLSVDDTLSLTVEVDAEYLGFSEADDNGYVYGTTYVIDFQDFNAHSDSIKKPGNCQNRADVFGDNDTSLTWDQVWAYSKTPNTDENIGNINYLAYAPGNLWTVEMSPDNLCTIKYKTTLSWHQLISCTNYDGSNGAYITAQDNANNITLSGTLYINVVSPFDYREDYGFYRVYQLLSQPFMMVVTKSAYVLQNVGINLLSMDIIAVYKEDTENRFRLIVLTESAQYLRLSRESLHETTSLFQVFIASDESNPVTSSNFRMLEEAETGNNCLENKQNICSQLWQFTAEDVECTAGGAMTDFSGTYNIQFAPECRAVDYLPGDTEEERSKLKEYCDEWLVNHLDAIQDSTAGDKVLLSTDLKFKDEICDPVIFNVQFEARMQFYTNAAFTDEVVDPSASHLFQVGEDEIYVKITSQYPLNTFSVFATELLNVWICTFDPLVLPEAITSDSQAGGCFDTDADDNSKNFVGHIYDLANGQKLEGFMLDTTSILESNVIQFQFIAPDKVSRDTLYVHAQIQVSLRKDKRRRMLVEMSSNQREANQMAHYVAKVSISPTPLYHHHHHDHPQDIPHQMQPIQAPSLQYQWMHIIIISSALVLVLGIYSIVMYYVNFLQPNRVTRYTPVKDVDSAAENDAIDIVSH